MNEGQITRLRLLIEQFKGYLNAEGYSERTVEGYSGELNHFIEYLRSSDVEEVSQITKATIQQYQLHLYNYRTRQGKPLSLVMQACLLVALRAFFRFLVMRGYFMYDPSSTIEWPRIQRGLPRDILSSKEIAKLLNQPDVETAIGLRDKAMLELLYSSGIRNSELRNLMVYDVDSVNLEVRIREGKGGKDRVVPLGEIAGNYIEEYIRHGLSFFTERREQFMKEESAKDREGYERENHLLFFGGRGRKLHGASVDRIVRHYAKVAGIGKRVTPHGIRHTFATHMLKGRAGIRYLQEMLGHKNLETTQIYTRVEVSDLKKEHRRCHPREQER